MKEDTLHALRDCSIASKCWEHISPPQLRGRFLGINDISQWINWNLSLGTLVMGLPWRVWFAVGCRHIWLNRNAQVFQNSALGFMQIIAQVRAVLSASERETERNRKDLHMTGSWKPPYIG